MQVYRTTLESTRMTLEGMPTIIISHLPLLPQAWGSGFPSLRLEDKARASPIGMIASNAVAGAVGE